MQITQPGPGSRTAIIALALLAAGSGAGHAGEWDLTGYAGIGSRAFRTDGRYPEQGSRPANSLVAQSEFYWAGAADRVQFGAVAFGRADSNDRERSHLDLREARFGLVGDGWDLGIGIDKVFWGVTESRHLIDVINQTDGVEDIDGEDKLGQPMVNLNLDREFGRLELFVLPQFRERVFPGPGGRLRTPVPVDNDAASFESRDGKRHTDVSIRYSHYFGDFDIGAYVFDGTAREPVFELNSDGTRLIPVYEQMRQAGLELQLTRDAVLWKFEAIARESASDSFAAAVTGIEYTFFGAGDSPADVGVLFEYLYDGRDSDAPPTAFDNDIFFGTRLAFNDVGDTSILAGAVIDIDSKESFINIEASRRLGDKLTLDARLRVFGNATPGDATYWLAEDDYLELTLSWYY